MESSHGMPMLALEVGSQHDSPAALPPEKTRYTLYRRLGPR